MATTVGDIINEVEQLGNRVDPSFRTRLVRGANRAQEFWAYRLPWDGLKRVETFQAPGGAYMHFPDRVMEIISIGDINNNYQVEAGDHWENRFPSLYFQNVSGTPREWRPVGISPVAAQPTTDTTLNIRTTVSEVFSVLVRGLVNDTTASGTPLEFFMGEETVNLTGSNYVATSNAYREVLAVEKPQDTDGQVLIQNAQDSALIGRIQPWEIRSAFKKIEFLYQPAGVTPLKVAYFTRPEPITSENQTLDASIARDYLVFRTTGDLHWIKNEREPAQVMWAKAEEVLQNRINAQRTLGDVSMQAIPDTMDFSDWKGNV